MCQKYGLVQVFPIICDHLMTVIIHLIFLSSEIGEANADPCLEDKPQMSSPTTNKTEKTMSEVNNTARVTELPSLEPSDEECENANSKSVPSFPGPRKWTAIIQTPDTIKPSCHEDTTKGKNDGTAISEKNKTDDSKLLEHKPSTSLDAAQNAKTDTEELKPNQLGLKVCRIMIQRCDSMTGHKKTKTVKAKRVSTTNKHFKNLRNKKDCGLRLIEKNSHKMQCKTRSQRLMIRNTKRNLWNSKTTNTKLVEPKCKARGRPKKLDNFKDTYKNRKGKQHKNGTKIYKYICSDCPSKFRHHLEFLKHKMTYHKQRRFSRVKLIKKEFDPYDWKSEDSNDGIKPMRNSRKILRKLPGYSSLRNTSKDSQYETNSIRRTTRRYSKRIVLKISLHSCSHCPAKFKQQTQLLNHKKSKHSSDGFTKQHSCRKCRKSFRVFGALHKHMKEAHPREMSYPCTWEMCKASFPNQYRLTRHLYAHQGVKPFKCNQPKCKLSFVDKWAFKMHERTHISRKH